MLADFPEVVAMTGRHETDDMIETPARELGKARGAKSEPVKVPEIRVPKKCRLQKSEREYL